MFRSRLSKKDLTRRYLFKNQALAKNLIQYIIKNNNCDIDLLEELSFLKRKKKYKFSENKLTNRCIVTGRTRGIISKYHLSRLAFKKLAAENLLYPFRRVSW